MLRSFCAQNFLSFKGAEYFTMIAGGTRGWQAKHTHPIGPRGDERLVAVSAFFGANGSGKTNLITAVMTLRSLVVDSARENTANSPLPYRPFMFDKSCRNSPTEFEITFSKSNKLYTLFVAYDEKRIHYERLESKELKLKARSRVLYEREFVQDEGEYDWYLNSALRGPKETWREATRDNALFLSTAVQLNSEAFLDVHNWFFFDLRAISGPMLEGPGFFDQYSALQCTDSRNRERIRQFLSTFDLQVDEIRVDESDSLEIDRKIFSEEIANQLAETSKFEVSFGRLDSQGKMRFLNLDEESSGTRALFALAGAIIDTIENGFIVFVDELNTNLHPLALNHLIQLFENRRVNRNGAQLIFTGHDISVFELRSLAKDQIWLLERRRDYSSSIRALSDFPVRKEDAIAKRFLQGRYGGGPQLIPSFESIFDVELDSVDERQMELTPQDGTQEQA